MASTPINLKPPSFFDEDVITDLAKFLQLCFFIAEEDKTRIIIISRDEYGEYWPEYLENIPDLSAKEYLPPWFTLVGIWQVCDRRPLDWTRNSST